jgi:putative ABC transport system substrate-binding protein
MISGIADEAGTRARLAAFLPALQRLGWTEGRNVQIEYRWGNGNTETLRKDAVELAALAPDVIVATGGATTTYVLQATHTVPIVFVIVPDPVGSGFVKSLSRPGGNATGFMQFEYSLSGKWLELLKQIAPNVTRAAVLWDPSVPAGVGQYAVIQSVAPALGADVFPIKSTNTGDMERNIADFAQTANGGLIVTANPWIDFLVIDPRVANLLATVHAHLGGQSGWGAGNSESDNGTSADSDVRVDLLRGVQAF